MNPITADASQCPVFRISAKDTNKFVILADSVRQTLPFVLVIEIFDAHGQTPPNTHTEAFENFYVLSGQGMAYVGEEQIRLVPGACLTVPPGTPHKIVNTKGEKLYVLTTMIPDEAFSSLIRRGVPAELDEEDRAVLLAQ